MIDLFVFRFIFCFLILFSVRQLFFVNAIRFCIRHRNGCFPPKNFPNHLLD